MMYPYIIYFCLSTTLAIVVFHFVWKFILLKTKSKWAAAVTAIVSYFGAIITLRSMTDQFNELNAIIVESMLSVETRLSITPMTLLVVLVTIGVILATTYLYQFKKNEN